MHPPITDEVVNLCRLYHGSEADRDIYEQIAAGNEDLRRAAERILHEERHAFYYIAGLVVRANSWLYYLEQNILGYEQSRYLASISKLYSCAKSISKFISLKNNEDSYLFALDCLFKELNGGIGNIYTALMGRLYAICKMKKIKKYSPCFWAEKDKLLRRIYMKTYRIITREIQRDAQEHPEFVLMQQLANSTKTEK